MKKVFLILLLAVFMQANRSNACTNYLVSKGASANGHTMISYAADSHLLYGELYFWPAMDWAEGTMLPIYEWDTGEYLGEIPQVAHTYSVVGNMNEYQVAIGETTFGGREELHVNQKGAIMDYGSLIYVALQRSKTAREAIKVMTDLVEKYGYYSTGESFSIADPNEVWIMEMMSKGLNEKGAIWVARKVPNGYVCGHANQARITTFPQKDKKQKECMFSPDVISFAKEKGWYKGKDKDFSFSDTYAPVDFGGARFCEIRVWTMFNKVNPDMQKYWNYAKGEIKHEDAFADGRKNPNGYATNRMPLFIKPNRKITTQDMMDFMRDHLEGTELDMSKDAGAGAFGIPYRWRPLTWECEGQTYCNERATATQQTGFSFIAEMRSEMPEEIGGILWFGVDDAASTVYTPMYSSMTRVPHTYAQGNGAMMTFSDDAAFWVFNQVTNFAYLRYNLIHPEIDSLQHKLEADFQRKVKNTDAYAKSLYKKDKNKAREFVTDFSVDNADALVYKWKDFYKYLFVKYMDGNVKKPNPGHLNPHLEQPGYSKDWYKHIIKETGTQFLMPEGAH